MEFILKLRNEDMNYLQQDVYFCKKSTMDSSKLHVEHSVIEALRKVHDPEIPVNIYDLGLIYDLRIDEDLNVYIMMTLTTPNCPVAEDMPGMVRDEISRVEGVKNITVDLTFDPPWDMDNLTDEAKLELGLL
jgi:FeS assembly SUF system protein